jgi:hypothetical protein
MGEAEPADDHEQGNPDRNPPRDRVEDDQDSFGDGDPESDPDPAGSQPPSDPARPVLERRPAP